MSRPLRIAVIGIRGVPSNYSGIERASEQIYSRLAGRGHQITVYCRPECLDTPIGQYRGLRLIRTPTIRRRSVETLLHSFLSIMHATSFGSYDLIHLHALAAGLFTFVGRLQQVPTLTTVHGLDWQRAKWHGLGCAVLRKAERSIAKRATDIIVVSRDLQKYFKEHYGRDAIYIPNGVEECRTPVSLNSDILQRFDLVQGQYIVYIGRLVPEKRIEDLIAAFRQCRTNVKLAIVGEGGYTDKYVDALRQAASGDSRILFTGLQKGTALDTLFRSATAFVSPSDLEGLPTALLEALERGVPAIVSDIPPHRELLESIAGYDLFAPCRDVNSLAENMRRLLEHRDHYAAVAQRAQSFVRARYSWETIANATEDLFLKAVEHAQQNKFGVPRTALPALDTETR